MLARRKIKTSEVSEDMPLPTSQAHVNIVNMRPLTFYRASILSLFFMFAQLASAAVFEVSTAEELQAALATAASNGGDDEILLREGTYFGNFKYVPEESFALKVTGVGRGKTTLDGNGKAYVFFLSAKTFTPNLLFSDLDLRNSSQSEGSVLRLTSSEDRPFGWNAGEVPVFRIANAHLNSSHTSHKAIFVSGIDLEMQEVNFEGGSLVCDTCSVFIDKSVLVIPKGSIEVGAVRIANSRISSDLFSSSQFLSGQRQFRAPEVAGSKLNVSSISFANGSTKLVENHIRSAYLRINAGGSLVSNVIEIVGFTDSFNSGFRIGTDPGLRDVTLDNNLVFGRASLNIADVTKLNLTSNTFVLPVSVSLSSGGSSQTVVNNVFDPFDEGAGLIVAGFAESATLKNNVLPTDSSSIWDVDTGNIIGDPGFYDPDNGDYHLSASSPAINSGTNETVASSETLDLDGNSRVIDGTIDIGAYERNLTALHPADTNGNSEISQDEFDLYNQAWRANEAWPTAPAAIPVDFVTRAGYLLQKGGTYKNIGVGKPQTWVPLSD